MWRSEDPQETADRARRTAWRWAIEPDSAAKRRALDAVLGELPIAEAESHRLAANVHSRSK